MSKSKNNLVTKSYLDRRLNQFGNKLKTELKGELRKELSEDLYQIKDEIVGEIRDMREEFDVHRFSYERIDDTLEEHNQRIAKLGTKS